MKKIICILAAFCLSACNAGAIDETQLPSASKAVPCEQSKECLMYGATAKTCNEGYIGNPPVMASTWDNGKTWLIGNCDSTAK